MRAIRKAILETVLLSALALAIAAGANAVRPKGSIDWGRDYFPAGEPVVAANTSEQPKHEFQQISFEELAGIFNDPDAEMGANIIVDARDDEAYEAGHIPGALHCDHYQLEDYLTPDVLDLLYNADKVIVYCNGGNCEVSIFLCRELRGFEIPHESLYLFEGGWKEWVAGKMQVATGPEGGEGEYESEDVSEDEVEGGQ